MPILYIKYIILSFVLLFPSYFPIKSYHHLRIHSKHLLTYIFHIAVLWCLSHLPKMVLLVCLKLTIKSKFQHSQSKYIIRLTNLHILGIRVYIAHTQYTHDFPSVYLYIIQNSEFIGWNIFMKIIFTPWAVYVY